VPAEEKDASINVTQSVSTTTVDKVVIEEPIIEDVSVD